MSVRLRVAAEVSNEFAMVTTDYRSLIETIARRAGDLIGDGCSVALLDADGESLSNVAIAHRDPELESVWRAHVGGLRMSRNARSPLATAVRTGQPLLVPEIAPETVTAEVDDALKPLATRLQVHSLAVAPIRANRSTIGALLLQRSRPGCPYGEEDLALLQDLADRAGLAIENARLYRDLERQVRQRTAELEAANRELDAFSYSVAHDLRAPLRSIDGFSQAVLEDYGDRLDAEGQGYLRRVRDSAQQMANLIDDLLTLSRVARSELHREAVDLTVLAHAVIGRLRASQPEREVDVRIAEGLVCSGDARLLGIALDNLLGNAWKFTCKRPLARIELSARQEGERREFLVRDNGAGFDMAHARNLFGAFQRLHRADDFEGTGIGLATVQRIVHRHGGRIRAEGEVDRGATFFFTLDGEAPA